MKSIRNLSTKKDKVFGAKQVGVRMDMEPAFGVLMSHFHILSTPYRYWSREPGMSVLRACIVLHNMCVASKSQAYNSEMFQSAVDGGDAVQFGADSNVQFCW